MPMLLNLWLEISWKYKFFGWKYQTNKKVLPEYEKHSLKC